MTFAARASCPRMRRSRAAQPILVPVIAGRYRLFTSDQILRHLAQVLVALLVVGDPQLAILNPGFKV
jgi:hypothetical protein